MGWDPCEQVGDCEMVAWWPTGLRTCGKMTWTIGWMGETSLGRSWYKSTIRLKVRLNDIYSTILISALWEAASFEMEIILMSLFIISGTTFIPHSPQLKLYFLPNKDPKMHPNYRETYEAQSLFWTALTNKSCWKYL